MGGRWLSTYQLFNSKQTTTIRSKNSSKKHSDWFRLTTYWCSVISMSRPRDTHTVKPDKTKLTIARMVDSGKFNTNPWNKQFLFWRGDQHKLSIPRASAARCQYWCIWTEGSAHRAQSLICSWLVVRQSSVSFTLSTARQVTDERLLKTTAAIARQPGSTLD